MTTRTLEVVLELAERGSKKTTTEQYTAKLDEAKRRSDAIELPHGTEVVSGQILFGNDEPLTLQRPNIMYVHPQTQERYALSPVGNKVVISYQKSSSGLYKLANGAH